MNFTEEFSLAAQLKEPWPVGAGPTGTRMVYEIIGGEVEGDRIRGKVLGGGEWALIGPDGVLRVDVRLQIETHDKAYIYMQYLGLLGLNETVQAALAAGGETQYGDQYFYTNPRLESGDERYSWVNTTFFVAQGRILANAGVGYRISRPA